MSSGVRPTICRDCADGVVVGISEDEKIARRRAKRHGPAGGARIRPRIHVITLAVDDLDRSVHFYRDGLGFETEGIVATEFAGSEEYAAGAIALFHLEGGLILSVYPRSELAKDARIAPGPAVSGSFSVGQLVASREDVDALLAAAESAGARITAPAYDRPFGIYSGYFQDPDGHLWEVIWNPAMENA